MKIEQEDIEAATREHEEGPRSLTSYERRAVEVGHATAREKYQKQLAEWKARAEKAEAILRRHIQHEKEWGNDEAATGTGDFADAPPCDCAGCETYRAAVQLLGGDDHAED